ncbi:hypothetical protein [Aureibacter tunicatorum]|uniref:DUF4249 family protein n=1 Tax=Aureibacter tunicatorum TaxID=866807 RepID=A0AAE3XSM9_9BACT|nr:hypothetical protein [Aureibacter tunicatorum]MDR6241373.1 hypothetical protein [Aureibacter tunicatorum]
MYSIIFKALKFLIIGLALIAFYSCNNSEDSSPSVSIQNSYEDNGLIPGQYTNIPISMNQNLDNAMAKVYMNDSLVQTINLDEVHHDSIRISHMLPVEYEGQNVQYRVSVESRGSASEIITSLYFDLLVYHNSDYRFVVDNRTSLNINFRNRVAFRSNGVEADRYRYYSTNNDNSSYDVSVSTSGQFVYNNRVSAFSYTIESMNPNETYLIRVPRSLLNSRSITNFIQTAYNVAQTARQDRRIQWADIADFCVMVVHQDGSMGVFIIENDFAYIKNIRYRGIRPD